MFKTIPVFRFCSKQSLCSGCVYNNLCVQILFKAIHVNRLNYKLSLWSGCVQNNLCVQVMFKTINVFMLCSKHSLCSGCVQNNEMTAENEEDGFSICTQFDSIRKSINQSIFNQLINLTRNKPIQWK